MLKNDFFGFPKVKWLDLTGTTLLGVHVKFSQDLTYQKLLKSVNFWQSYSKNKKVYVFWHRVYITDYRVASNPLSCISTGSRSVRIWQSYCNSQWVLFIIGTQCITTMKQQTANIKSDSETHVMSVLMNIHCMKTSVTILTSINIHISICCSFQLPESELKSTFNMIWLKLKI